MKLFKPSPLQLHNSITYKGYREQDKIAFSGLYPEFEKRNTRNNKGRCKEFENNLKRGKFKV